MRHTEEETAVVPNLMAGFSIDEVQAEYVAEIRLRHLNREYILKRTEETEQLEQEIDRLQAILDSKAKVKHLIIQELQQIIKKYGQPRKTMLVYPEDLDEPEEWEEAPDYPVYLFLSREGYVKKNYPAVFAHERGAEAQRRRPDNPAGGGRPTPATCCFLPTARQYTKRRCRILRIPRPASSANMYRQNWAWKRGKLSCMPQ